MGLVGEKPILEKSRGEIEHKLASMGDYVKMSYLQRALKSALDFETKKYVSLKLATIYEERRMYIDAARLVKAAAEITTTFREKIQTYMKAIELHVRGGDYVEADRLFAQALALGNNMDKVDIKMQYKNFYINQAKSLIIHDRRNNAKVLYEKVLALDLNPSEKGEIQKTLLDLYYKLGNVKEYYALKTKIGSP